MWCREVALLGVAVEDCPSRGLLCPVASGLHRKAVGLVVQVDVHLRERCAIADSVEGK